MRFSDAVSLKVRQRAHFSCCLCKALGVEVHHILPRAEGGTNSEDNAAPLCPSCHEAYGANPTKRKFIREARDHWYELCGRRFASDRSLLADLHATISQAASKADIEGLRQQLAGLQSPQATPNSLASTTRRQKRSLTVSDLLIGVLTTAGSSASGSQAALLTTKELWPTGKDDLRGVYNAFLQRFGKRILEHLAGRVLKQHRVRHVEWIAEPDLERCLRTLYVEATCWILLDDGHVRASVDPSGAVRWMAAPKRHAP